MKQVGNPGEGLAAWQRELASLRHELGELQDILQKGDGIGRACRLAPDADAMGQANAVIDRLATQVLDSPAARTLSRRA